MTIQIQVPSVVEEVCEEHGFSQEQCTKIFQRFLDDLILDWNFSEDFLNWFEDVLENEIDEII